MTPSPPEKQAPRSDGQPGLTIGELARRTGLNPATLRMWEARYGFPRAERLPSGHRRYADRAVEEVEQVLRRRDAGARLEAAVAAVAGAGSVRSLPSVFADLRERHPHLPPRTLRKSTLLALSWALEDECCARAQHAWLFGTFQEEGHYRRAERRWRDLARTARGTWVLADFRTAAPDEPPAAGVPVEVPLGRDSAMSREWSVVCLAPDFPAVLTAWELPGQAGVPDSHRLFESLWSLEPQPVADAARCCARVVQSLGHDTAAVVHDADRLDGTPPADVRHATGVFSRALGYLEAAG